MAKFSLGNDNEEEEEQGTNTRPGPVPKKRRTLDGTFSCSAAAAATAASASAAAVTAAASRRETEEDSSSSSEEEDEEDEIVEEEEEEESSSESESDREVELNGSGSATVSDPDLEGSRENGGEISVTLADPDVLDCPICLESLSIPVFQCENGHIACSSCCIKIANKCPSCCWPIGYNRCRAIEKVLESVKVRCTNKRHGCKETMSYCKKADHENACIYVPCSCPYSGCDFVGPSIKLYAHFSNRHGSSAEKIFFNAEHPIYIEKHQHYQILQEESEGIIFIINHSSERLGSAVNIVCVGPSSQKRRFAYELVATDGESTFKLESIAESIPNWSETSPMRKFLLVPKDVSSGGQLKVDVFIEECE